VRLDCKAGKYCPTYGLSTNDLDCQEGYYCAARSTSPTATPCALAVNSGFTATSTEAIKYYCPAVSSHLKHYMYIDNALNDFIFLHYMYLKP
jgi:hypothetical protein